MSGGKIYPRENDGLVPMTEAPYRAEGILQRLLADYRDLLLAGDQVCPDEPRRWLVIAREAGIPDTEGGLRQARGHPAEHRLTCGRGRASRRSS